MHKSYRSKFILSILFLVASIMLLALFFALPKTETCADINFEGLNAPGKVDVVVVEDADINIKFNGYPCKYSVSGTYPDSEMKVYYYVDDNWTTDAPTDAGEYSIKLSSPETDLFNAFEKEIEGKLIIAPVDVTFTIDDIALGTSGYVYDKEAKTTTASYQVDMSSTLLSHLIDNDLFEVEYELAYSLNGLYFDRAIEAGEWDVEISSARVTKGIETNFNLIYSDTGKMTIEQKEVSLLWSQMGESDLVYSGTEKMLSATVEGLEAGDECSVEVELFSGCDNKNVTASGFFFEAKSLSNENYKLPSNAISSNYVITKKPVTLTIVDVLSGNYVYDGQSKSTTALVDGLVGNDELTYNLIYSKDNVYNATSAGEWRVSIYSAEIISGLEGNYEIDKSDIGVMVIDKRPVTVTVVDVGKGTSGYVYDKTPKTTTITHTPLVGSDVINATLIYQKGSQTDHISAGEWIVKIESVSVNGTSPTDYVIDISDEGVMVIDPKEISLSWSQLSQSDLIYSGTEKMLSATVEGLESGDECSVEVELLHDCDNINAGDFAFKAVSLSNSNYTLPLSVNSPSFTITKKQLTVTARNYTVTYGDEISSFELVYEGFAQGEGVEVLDILPTASSYYNSNTNVSNSGIKISVKQGNDTNYSFKCFDGEITILRKNITVTAENKTSLEGEKLVELTYAFDGLVLGDVFSGNLYTDAVYDQPGVYNISQGSLVLNDNYVVSFEGASYTINAKSLVGSVTESSVPAVIAMKSGVNPLADFVVEAKSASDVDWFELNDDEELVRAYNAQLSSLVDGETYVVKIEVPSGTKNINSLCVLIKEKGEIKRKALLLEGDYVSFSTSELGDFVIVQTKVDYSGVIIVAVIIAVVFVCFFIWYMSKRRREYKTVKFD